MKRRKRRAPIFYLAPPLQSNSLGEVNDFVRLVEESIAEKRLFSRGQRILVAVSGGVDSMVLLHLLHRLARENDWRLVVAHFNHQLRGRSSDADERFVREAAERLDIPFVAGRADVKRSARQQGLSLEMAARQLRHEFLARAATGEEVSAIALGHHADDQVELFFLRLLRGAGGEGLAGMKWLNPSPYSSKVMLVRPLLGCPRKEIELFARSAKIAFRQDKTNLDVDILRNRFRQELLPLLVKHYQPALCKTTLRLMDLVAAESEFVTQSAMIWLERREAGFDQLAVAVQRRSLQLQLFRLGLKVDFEGIEHLRLRPGSPLTLSPAVAVLRDASGTVEIRNPAQPQFDGTRLELKLAGKGGTIQFGGLEIVWEVKDQSLLTSAATIFEKRPEAEIAGRQREPRESFDADKVGVTIALRHWQSGDRFQPIGMAASVKLQDLFVNLKVPRARRHRLVVAATAGGELFWVEGLRISERFKLDESTARRMNWCWQRISC